MESKDNKLRHKLYKFYIYNYNCLFLSPSNRVPCSSDFGTLSALQPLPPNPGSRISLLGLESQEEALMNLFLPP